MPTRSWESVPVTRSTSEEVFASTLVVDGHLCICAERMGTNTRAGVILTRVESTPIHDTRVENLLNDNGIRDRRW